MTRAGLLCAAAILPLLSSAAAAQVTVPLPGGRPSGTPTPNPAPAPAPAKPLPPGVAPLPPTVGQSSMNALPIGKYGRPDINPYDRDLDMTVPLTFRGRSLGDLAIRLTFDDQLFVDAGEFLRLITPLLSAKAVAEVTAAIGDRPRFSSADLSPIGIAFEYDPSSLAVVVLTIDPRQRALERLFAPPTDDNERPDLAPAHFSGFLNLNVLQSYYWEDKNSPPTVGFNGAIRLGRVVFEGDAEVGDQGGFSGNDYKFERNYARLVLDEPGQYRRWQAGDLSPEIRGQQSFVQMGGVGVLRQRRRFDQFTSAVLQGNRQLVLQRDSSVRIIRNGVLYRELQLDAGSYDFSSLPLLSGSNDVQLEVRDSSGAVQAINYHAYLDPIDLEPGDFEYAAYVGPTSRSFGRSPVYDGPVAFSGFFRKAFLDKPAIGIGVQASRDVQTLTGQTQCILPNGGRILFDLGASNSRTAKQGFSVGLSYDQLFDRGGSVDSFSIRADYVSSRFSGLGNPDGRNPSSLSLNGQYTRSFTQQIYALVNATYVKNRNNLGDSYRIGVGANYYINRRWSVRGGVDYSKFERSFSRGNGLGFIVALVFQPDYRQRAEARHDSSTDTTTLSYLRASTNQIGSVGFGGVVGRDFGTASAQGFVDYTGNRFDATISHASYGRRLSSIGDRNVTTVRVGTSFAFADGAFGIGRRINDSFAILYPHDNLGSRSVVAGQSLARNEYIGKSGALGGAVNSFLSSYTNQSIQYDVEDPPAGYDIGPGVARVKPPYHSGYKLRVGTEAFVTAMGTLLAPDGSPVALAGGRVLAKDGKDKEAPQFFTNSTGRFAIANLRPGVQYHVEIYGGAAAFDFSVPSDTTGLVDLKVLRLAGAQ